MLSHGMLSHVIQCLSHFIMLSMFHLHGKHWDVVFDHNRQVTMFSLSCNLASYIQWGNEKVPFLAVQNSSIGDLVTHSLTDSLSE